MAWTRDQLAARPAIELPDGFHVNPGIGVPTLAAADTRYSFGGLTASSNWLGDRKQTFE